MALMAPSFPSPEVSSLISKPPESSAAASEPSVEIAVMVPPWAETPKEWLWAVSYTHLTLPTICSV